MRENFTRESVCFEDVVVGLSKITTWYQFGFKVPQGPINLLEFPVSELQYFREDFKYRLFENAEELVNGVGKSQKRKKTIVVFSRSQTRKILNMGPLMFKLTTHFKLPVQKLDLEVDSMEDIVRVMSTAYIVIGVHGAHLVTGIFMPPGSILVEIFPYGVPSKNYTPYKTLAMLMGVHYISWENTHIENTVTHEEYPSWLGGIAELPLERQEEIRGHITVPEHLCCKDPVWLFRIYQDTKVEVGEIIEAIEDKIHRGP